MKKMTQTKIVSLMLLDLGLSGCSQSEGDISSSDITSFAVLKLPIIVAELTQQLRVYNANLCITTLMSHNI